MTTAPATRSPVLETGRTDESPWQSILLSSLVGLAALLLGRLLRVTSLPWVGWAPLDPPFLQGVVLWLVGGLPGLLVGWTSRSGYRSVPILVTLVAFLLLVVPGMAYFWQLGLVIILLFFAATVGLGIGARLLLHGRRRPRVVLTGLLTAAAGAALFLWFVDGWRYIFAETDVISRVSAKRPGQFLAMDQGDWEAGLQEAVERCIARQEFGRARTILTKLERSALVLAGLPGSSMAEDLAGVARLWVEARDDDHAKALLNRIGASEEKKNLVWIHGYAQRGDTSRAAAIADTFPASQKFSAYEVIAVESGRAGRLADARQAVRELFRLKESEGKGVSPAAYYFLAYTQAESGLYSDAIATVSKYPGQPDNSPYSRSPQARQLEAFKSLAQAAIGNRSVDQTRPIYLAAREALRACRDPQERDALLRELAIEQGKQGFSRDAEDTAALIEDSRSKADLLSGMSHWGGQKRDR